MAEYESTFTSLSRFSPEMVVTDAHRCRRFERGLRAQILDRVLTLRIRVYSELVDTAMAVERGLSEAARVRESRQRPSSVAVSFESRDSKRQRTSGFFRPQAQSSRLRQTAGVAAVGPVVAEQGPVCFTCNRPGHMRRDCPKDRRLASRPASRQSNLGSRLTGTEVRCYGCGLAGHIASRCPSQSRGMSEQRPQQSRTVQSPSTRPYQSQRLSQPSTSAPVPRQQLRSAQPTASASAPRQGSRAPQGRVYAVTRQQDPSEPEGQRSAPGTFLLYNSWRLF